MYHCRKIFALSIVVVFLLSACSGESGSNFSGYSTKVLHVNNSNSMISSTQHIIRAKGFLEAHLPKDVTVEWSNVVNSADVRDAVMTDSVDIAGVTIIEFAAMMESDLPAALLSFGSSTTYVMLSNDATNNSIANIADSARIGVSSTVTPGYLAFLIACKDEFDYPFKFKNNIVPVNNIDHPAALLASKSVDYAITGFPISTIVERDGGTVVMDFADIIGKNDIGTVFFAKPEFIKKNPVLIDAFYAAQKDAIAYIMNFPDEASRILANLYKVEATEITAIWKKMPPHMNLNKYDQATELMYKLGFLTKQPKKLSELPNYDKIPKEK